MSIRRFEDMECWQLARELTKQVYRVSGKGLFAKDFELRGQIRAAAGSAMHNCAEGFDGGSNPEFVRFFGYAQRSCTEVKSQLYAATDQAYITQDEFDEIYALATRTHGKIGGFIKYLSSIAKPTPGKPRTKN